MRFSSISRRYFWQSSLSLLGGLFTSASAQSVADASEAPFFEDLRPPAAFQGKFSDSRSPLIFQDGSRATSAEAWQSRRAEIEKQWHEAMGPWPAKIEKPRFDILETTEREGILQHKIRVEVAPGQFPEGYLLQPKKAGKLPAVFVPFYEPNTAVGIGGKPLRDFALQMAKRGIVTLSLGTPEGDAFHPILPKDAKCQPLSYYGYVSGNVYRALAALDFVDAQSVGIMGHSYGGKWAMFGACFNPEYACGVWSDPGVQFDDTRTSVNYWEPWYLGLDEKAPRKKRGLITEENPSAGAYRVLSAQGNSLAEVQSLMAPRPFFVSGGSEDFASRWEELNHVTEVYKLFTNKPRFGLSLRPKHDPTVESNEKIYAFFDWVFSAKLRK